nr:TIGR03364 family FAD-dependent oxidoreductase [Saprospiraceae bacterium]
LFPELFVESDITLEKLQMMETIPQKVTVKIPGSILTGWTIRRYESFQECPSYQEIKSKENEQDFQRRFGVHILFKQTAEGSVILGDSHEYAHVNHRDELRLFETNEIINSFMTDSASKILDIDYKIARTWIGCYSQRKSGEIYHHTKDERIHIVTAIGGKGMTGNLGWAEEHINKLF